MSSIFLSGVDVETVVSTISPWELVALMARVFSRLSSYSASTAPHDLAVPHRTVVSIPNYSVLFMPSRLAQFGTAIKVVSVPTISASSDVREKGLPATTIVIDEDTGQVKAIVNAGKLTALRNAAGSLLSAILLIPPLIAPRSIVAVGSGAQIAAHVALFLRHYPSVTRCTIFNRTVNARLANLLATLRADPVHGDVRFEGRALPQDRGAEASSRGWAAFAEILRDASVVITATSSTVPLFPSSYISPGTHLCLIGSYTPQMHEVDTDLVKRAGLVIVDSKEACKMEAGELIAANITDTSLIEIGDLVSADSEWDVGQTALSPKLALIERVRNSGDVTIFKSVGVGVQDVAIASAVVDRAKANGIGTVLQL